MCPLLHGRVCPHDHHGCGRRDALLGRMAATPSCFRFHPRGGLVRLETLCLSLLLHLAARDLPTAPIRPDHDVWLENSLSLSIDQSSDYGMGCLLEGGR